MVQKFSIVITAFLFLLSFEGYSNPIPSIIKIAPYGNSITQAAGDHQSYRYPLWKKLIDANISFDFVGSMNTNFGGNPLRADYKGKKFDQDHEGHWGWRADELLRDMDKWLVNYTPDMVLFHIGTNDCIQNQDVNSTISELTQIVTKLRNDNKNVVIFMATLIPCNASSQAATNVNNLNTKIKTLVEQLSTQQSPVILVDQNSGIASSDLYDGVHPGLNGEEKMAQKWFDAISKYLVTPTIENVSSSNSRNKNEIPSYQLKLNCSQNAQQENSMSNTNGTTFDLLGKTLNEVIQAPNKPNGILIVSDPINRNKKWAGR
jgi:lysophospholipase L1-like esterase